MFACYGPNHRYDAIWCDMDLIIGLNGCTNQPRTRKEQTPGPPVVPLCSTMCLTGSMHSKRVRLNLGRRVENGWSMAMLCYPWTRSAIEKLPDFGVHHFWTHPCNNWWGFTQWLTGTYTLECDNFSRVNFSIWWVHWLSLCVAKHTGWHNGGPQLD